MVLKVGSQGCVARRRGEAYAGYMPLHLKALHSLSLLDAARLQRCVGYSLPLHAPRLKVPACLNPGAQRPPQPGRFCLATLIFLCSSCHLCVDTLLMFYLRTRMVRRSATCFPGQACSTCA